MYFYYIMLIYITLFIKKEKYYVAHLHNIHIAIPGGEFIKVHNITLVEKLYILTIYCFKQLA